MQNHKVGQNNFDVKYQVMHFNLYSDHITSNNINILMCENNISANLD